jgi:hypothetical protein
MTVSIEHNAYCTCLRLALLRLEPGLETAITLISGLPETVAELNPMT